MKPESQIEALAELDGWSINERGWIIGPQNQVGDELPDYLGDMNSIRELVLNIRSTDDFKMCFLHELHRICAKNGDMGWGIATAGPEKWCEAVLRTAGKWVEE